MRARDAHICLDVRATPHAHANTDHRLVTARLRLPRTHHKPPQRTPAPPQVDIAQLSEPVKRKQYDLSSTVEVEALPPNAEWGAISAALLEAGMQTLGARTGKQRATWQVQYATELRELQRARQASSRDPVARRAAAKATRRRIRAITREYWMGKLQNMSDNTRPKAAWSAMRDLGVFFSPNGSRAHSQQLVDSSGRRITDPAESDKLWWQHFSSLLNCITAASPAALQTHAASCRAADINDSPPTIKEVEIATAKLKRWKAAGPDGLPAELLRGPGAVGALHKIISQAWSSHTLPPEWRNARLVPIPKKGDRSQVGNWRGICLLAAASKALGHVLLARLKPRKTLRCTKHSVDSGNTAAAWMQFTA